MTTPADILMALRIRLSDAYAAIQAAARDVDAIAPYLHDQPAPEEPDWTPMTTAPPAYGHYKTRLRVRGEIIVAYSTWTGYAWFNCFPIQERLGWAI
jgi:hypothetical protein